MDRYAGLINATRANSPITPARLRQRVEHHAEIVKAIASGDVEEAGRAAAAHVRAAGEDMLAQMRQARSNSARTAELATAEVAAPRPRRRVAAVS